MTGEIAPAILLARAVMPTSLEIEGFSMSQYKDLYDKLLSDENFRKFLLKNPSGALESIGMNPTPEVLDAVKEVIKGVSEMDKLLGRGEQYPDAAS